jgi:glycosyltransferase involved in cell wall biosynthesis
VADVVVGNSLASLAVYGHSPEKNRKFVCIPNGIDLGRFDGCPAGKSYSRKPLELVMVANFTPAKDHSTVIAGVAGLIDRGFSVRMTFVGDGPLFEKVKNSIPEHLSNYFHFAGKRADVDDIVKASSVGVLLNSPGHAEGMSNSIMEYMAAGLPVVCTDAGGNPETVTNGENGVLIPYSSPEGFVDAFTSSIINIGVIESMGKASRLRVENEFSIEKMAQRYLSLYRSLEF